MSPRQDDNKNHKVTDRRLQRYALKEGYVGYPPQPDRMHPIDRYILRGAGCHDECEDHHLHGAPHHWRLFTIEHVEY
eukprot:6182560-Pleurochrysis_carterae.AAC.2